MCVGSPIAGTWSSSQWRLDNEFETDTPPKLDHLVLAFLLSQRGHVQTDHVLRGRSQPPPGRRARDADIRRDRHIPGPMDQLPEAVVVPALPAGRARHAADHPPRARATQLPVDAVPW